VVAVVLPTNLGELRIEAEGTVVATEERGSRVCKELEEEDERFTRLEEERLSGMVGMPQREGMFEVELLFVGMRGTLVEEGMEIGPLADEVRLGGGTTAEAAQGTEEGVGVPSGVGNEIAEGRRSLFSTCNPTDCCGCGCCCCD
jgi:hypothetical protein